MSAAQNAVARARLLILSIISLLCLSMRAIGADFRPILTDQHVGVSITKLDLPNTLNKELKSGLTNKMLVRISLSIGDAKTAEQVAAEVRVKYDLWDESFRLQVLVNDVIVASTTYPRIEEVIAHLTSLRLPRLFAVNNLTGKKLGLTAEVLINPIDRERMDKLRSFVVGDKTLPSPSGARVEHIDSSNGVGRTGGVPPSGGISPSAGVVVTSRPNTVFNKIFEQYMSGAELTAAWRDTFSFTGFTLEELHDESE